MAEVEFNLARQAEAAKRLMSNLRSQGVDDDQELVADTIEGGTTLLEAIQAALAEIDECEIHIIGLKAKEAEFAERRRRLEERAGRVKATIEQAMITTEQESFRLPTATLTLTKRAPGLIVTNEADIPTRFWIEQERPAPKLDKKALRAALDDQPIPGATLDNGSRSLSIRRK
ncbi:Gp157 family protein [Rhizobium leguminosarum bv. trifolii WSM2304]|uniref:Gp157 family protein n=1 Tax=Rhizobium leguminosarum bv. trifolii (strain WSM2304) TaxID=395492 RepID=A0ABF7QNJ7_RHILW|nr:siphovirus Gp157 family protein [Rhizobium leguminosarum]ACI55738.1 Gp157 family protein [Rhizobium leguminosarum bv. trifolii WSM2304]